MFIHAFVLEEVLEHIDKGEYEEAADVLCEEMTDFDFRKRISAVFSRVHLEENKDKLSSERKLLRRLFTGIILTTNYDKVLESIFEKDIIKLCPHIDYTRSQIDELQQGNHSAIIKLHGDIDDVHNAVITSTDYNTRYGTPEGNTPLKRALSQILAARPVLFMGCSLCSDRILQVLSSCIGTSRKYFALVELPKETQNDDQPFLPNIVTPEGKENAKYRARRQFLGKHHISCIWYPYGMHDALDTLLKQLCSELFPEHDLVPLSPMFQNKREIIGRDETINGVVDTLNKGDTITFVSGSGGIGKTEICRCAVNKFLMTEPDVAAFYVELYGVQTIPTFCATIAKALKLDSLPETTEADSWFAWLSDAMKRQYAGQAMLLYFDNFEDVWFGLSRQETERIKLLQWLEQQVLNHIRVLISGRDSLRAYNFRITFHIVPPLDSNKQDDRKLFNLIYAQKGGKKPTQGSEYTELLKKLDGHPLTIVLVATYAAGVPNWNFVLDEWSTAQMHGANERHNSLRTALAMSWNCICDDYLCVDLWGILALSIEEVTIATLSKLFLDESSKWKNALTVLHDASLVTWSENAITMLSPIKEFFSNRLKRALSNGQS